MSWKVRHAFLKVLKELPKVLDNFSLELGKQKDRYRISIETKVDNPFLTTDSFNRQFQLGEKEREAVKGG